MSAVPTLDLAGLNAEFASASPTDVLAWAVATFGAKRVAIASSFGVEDVALIHFASQLPTPPRVFMLDTGRLHQETYDVVDRIRTRYRLPIEVYYPETVSLQSLVTSVGPNSFYDSIEARKDCCHVRKVEPLSRALADVDAWVTGLRREQSVTRADAAIFERDTSHGGILKLNPLRAWSESDVWGLVRSEHVPYNALHDRGFPSIGCAPCTRAIADGEDVRAGRWWWENPELRECGLHLKTGPEATSGP